MLLASQIMYKINYFLFYRNEIIELPSKGPYPPTMLHDFPKFLTDEISVLEVEKLKERERLMQEHNRKVMQLAETNRLKHEAKSFMEHIHEERLNGKTEYRQKNYNYKLELKVVLCRSATML